MMRRRRGQRFSQQFNWGYRQVRPRGLGEAHAFSAAAAAAAARLSSSSSASSSVAA